MDNRELFEYWTTRWALSDRAWTDDQSELRMPFHTWLRTQGQDGADVLAKIDQFVPTDPAALTPIESLEERMAVLESTVGLYSAHTENLISRVRELEETERPAVSEETQRGIEWCRLRDTTTFEIGDEVEGNPTTIQGDVHPRMNRPGKVVGVHGDAAWVLLGGDRIPVSVDTYSYLMLKQRKRKPIVRGTAWRALDEDRG
jgi:hypothetical protein